MHGQLALALLVAMVAQSPLVTISIYPSGYAHVTISDQVVAFRPVNLSLIGQPEGLTASYSNNSPVLFTLSNGSIQLIPSANGTVYVDYYTFSIVEKNSMAWFVEFNTEYPTELVLPYNASLVYINAAPAGATVYNGSLVLDLSPGNWTVSYLLPPPYERAPSTPPTPQRGPSTSPALVALIVLIAASAAAAVGVLRARRPRRSGRDPDDRIIEFLRRNGGSASEAEIRRALVLPKTTCWRAIKRLEREGKVRVEKRDKENVVYLN
ncbi:MAG: helix-turn-helix transcriptional regulator [Conexivisphaera sp.]